MSTINLKDRLTIKRKILVAGDIEFKTAWRVGSGREGETGSDLGVMTGHDNRPVLPGSSLKGKLRSTCEKLAHAFALKACCLDYDATQVRCTSDQDYFQLPNVHEDYEKRYLKGSFDERMNWITDHTCDICRIFGSPHIASKLRMTDGMRTAEHAGDHVQLRDSVVLDRDSHTAVAGLKYDYEVVSSGSRFNVRIEVENPEDHERALIGAALIEWTAGVALGGFTSRGLGSAKLHVQSIREVDFDDPEQMRQYLTASDPESRMRTLDDWQTHFTKLIGDHIK